jgi:hypothetical protein
MIGFGLILARLVCGWLSVEQGIAVQLMQAAIDDVDTHKTKQTHRYDNKSSNLEKCFVPTKLSTKVMLMIFDINFIKR